MMRPSATAPVSDAHRANLARLADHLDIVPQDSFDMKDFMRSSDGDPLSPRVHACGSVACAVGHGPASGIPSIQGEGWDDYASRVFSSNTLLWEGIFDGAWYSVDNTPQGAAARIRRFLSTGRLCTAYGTDLRIPHPR